MNSTATVQSLSEDEPARLPAGPNSPATAGSTDDATAEAPTRVDASLSKDDLFHLLQTSRRRAVIRYLRGREGPVRMRDVAEQVAAWEHDTTVAQLTSAERQRVYIALYQSHLETLADAGVIAYNKPRGVIEPQPLLDEVASYLDVDLAASTDGAEAEAEAGADAPRLGQHQVVAVGVTLLVLGTVFGLAGLGLLSWGVVSVLLVGLALGAAMAKLVLDGGETVCPIE